MYLRTRPITLPKTIVVPKAFFVPRRIGTALVTPDYRRTVQLPEKFVVAGFLSTLPVHLSPLSNWHALFSN
jgi:hypothetical protein